MKRLCGLLSFYLTLLLTCLFAAEPQPLVSKIPGDRREFQIVATRRDADQASATFSSALGIFAFHLNLNAAKLSKLTLIIQKQVYCEGLTLQKTEGREIDLRTISGVKIQQHDGDTVIEFDATALRAMQPGGNVQYVNQYR